MNEHNAREYVSKLRRFYTDALIYVVVNLGLVLIWAISGGGYFWPIWVIVGWGIGLGVHAFSLGLIPQINAWAPFLTPEWEERQVQELMKKEQKGKGPEKAAPHKATVQKAAGQKIAVQKMAGQKITAQVEPKSPIKKKKAPKRKKATAKKALKLKA
ncbi:MAG: hypothetical protein BGO67_02050 [Alphaproteobacteria bacterium 41-28]|nr:MAG: hypothetical protein BGO67_02050 [Alphaproteobacteria bacterium 41-28]